MTLPAPTLPMIATNSPFFTWKSLTDRTNCKLSRDEGNDEDRQTFSIANEEEADDDDESSSTDADGESR